MPAHPPTYTTVAYALKAVRMQCWSQVQLHAIDSAIDEVAEGFASMNPRFDAERFRQLAFYGYGRTVPPRQHQE